MRPRLLALLTLACTLTLGCSQQRLLERFAPHPQAEHALAVLDELRAGHVEVIRSRLTEQLQEKVSDAQLRAIAAKFPGGKLESVKLVGARTSLSNSDGTSSSRYALTYEYQFSDGWMLASVVLRGRGDAERIAGIQLRPLEQSLEQANRFSLRGKGLSHLLFALLAVAIPLSCIYAFVACLRTPIPRRKWLWALFTLTGLGTATLNWSTGAIGFRLLSVQLFGASAMATPYGPWIVGVSFPLGAIMFMARRKSWQRAAPPALPPERDGAA